MKMGGDGVLTVQNAKCQAQSCGIASGDGFLVLVLDSVSPVLILPVAGSKVHLSRRLWFRRRDRFPGEFLPSVRHV